MVEVELGGPEGWPSCSLSQKECRESSALVCGF